MEKEISVAGVESLLNVSYFVVKHCNEKSDVRKLTQGLQWYFYALPLSHWLLPTICMRSVIKINLAKDKIESIRSWQKKEIIGTRTSTLDLIEQPSCFQTHRLQNNIITPYGSNQSIGCTVPRAITVGHRAFVTFWNTSRLGQMYACGGPVRAAASRRKIMAAAIALEKIWSEFRKGLYLNTCVWDFDYL